MHAVTQSPVGSLPPHGQHVVFDLINIFRYDDEGQIVDEYIRSTTTPSSYSKQPRRRCVRRVPRRLLPDNLGSAEPSRSTAPLL